MASPPKIQFLFQYFQNRPFMHFGRCGAQNGTDGLGRSSLLSNDFSQIFFCHTQLNDGRLLTDDFSYFNFIGIIN